MASTCTSENGAKKGTLFGPKRTGRKKSAGQRRNSEISAKAGKAAGKSSAVLPRMEFEMALEFGGPEERDWKGIIRDAAEAAGGDLLFVLPYCGAGDGITAESPAGPTPVEHAMIRLIEGGESRLLLVRSGAAGFHLIEEDAIEAGLIRFARASIDVLERLGRDNRVVAPLVTLASH